MARVEVRIPTFRRPQWLRNALDSLLEQDHQDWIGIVFDDSKEREGRLVVDSCGDSRIVYRPNERNMGAAANLNQCFRTKPYENGTHACVLEDDNWLYPDFISSNLQAMKASGTRIVHRNQQVWNRQDGQVQRASHTTLGHRYFRQQMSPLQLHANVFFFPGISNGAIFFETGIGQQLMVPSEEPDPSLQEYLRCLSISETSAFLHEPKAAFAWVPVADTARHYAAAKYFSAAVQELQRRTVSAHGSALLDEVKNIAESGYSNASVEKVLANIGELPAVAYLKKPSLLPYWFRGVGKSLLYHRQVKQRLCLDRVMEGIT